MAQKTFTIKYLQQQQVDGTPGRIVKSMQMEMTLATEPNKMCFTKIYSFSSFPEGGTSRRPLVLISIITKYIYSHSYSYLYSYSIGMGTRSEQPK